MEWSHEIQEVDLSSNSEPRFLQLDQIPALGSIEYCNPTRWLSRHKGMVNWKSLSRGIYVGDGSVARSAKIFNLPPKEGEIPIENSRIWGIHEHIWEKTKGIFTINISIYWEFQFTSTRFDIFNLPVTNVPDFNLPRQDSIFSIYPWLMLSISITSTRLDIFNLPVTNDQYFNLRFDIFNLPVTNTQYFNLLF